MFHFSLKGGSRFGSLRAMLPSPRTDPAVVMLPFALKAMEALGADGAELLAACGIDPSMKSVSAPSLERFWARAEAAVGHSAVGLSLAEAMEPGARTSIVYLCMSSRTLKEGLLRLAEFMPLLTPHGTFRVRVDGPETSIEFGLGPPGHRHEDEFICMLILRLCRFVTAHDVRPLRVRFPHSAPADLTQHHRALGPQVAFGVRGAAAIVLRTADIVRPSVHADPELCAVHERYARERLGELQGVEVVRHVRQELRASLGRDPIDVDSVAARLGLSQRTLQRRLAEADASFAELLDNARKARALERIADVSTPLKQVAAATGFSGAAALSRAFKRWTGSTPSQYRRDLLAR